LQDKLSLNLTNLAREWREIPQELDESLKGKLLNMPIDELWREIETLKNFRDEPLFPNLSKLAACIITMPHSNADAERAFCIVTDVKTKKRNRMGEESLNAIAVTRTSFSAKEIDCSTFPVRKEHLSKMNQSIYD